MEGFPSEFSDILKDHIWSGRRTVTPIAGSKDRLRWFPTALRSVYAARSLELLEHHMSPFLRPVSSPISPHTITGMKENFAEALPKTMRNSSISLNSSRSFAFTEARKIGLIDLLRSSSLREFASVVSGFPLEDDPGLQLIRYRRGDYVGPHNDHHPEDSNLSQGYVDLQITLTNTDVLRQCFLYECDGYLNKSVEVSLASGVSISLLPFWHQVTPLEVKAGSEDKAHRWLLLVSFEIAKDRMRERCSGLYV